ncbi:MAG: hypothetical protein VX793_10240 [Pseudomonadota bacterium]|nr:hypothetical protein [Pseudomonadota bacterium]
MADWLCGILAVLLFSLVQIKMGILVVGKNIFSTAHEVLGVLGNTEISDDDKERHMRDFALLLSKNLFLVIFITLLSLLSAFVFLWVCVFLGVVAQGNIETLLVSWKFLIAVSVLALIAFATFRFWGRDGLHK